MTNEDLQLDAEGCVFNGFDYALQVWVIGGVVQNCGHPRPREGCCNGAKYAGRCVAYIPGHEVHDAN